MIPADQMAQEIARGVELLAQVDAVLAVYERMRQPEIESATQMPALMAEIHNLKQVRRKWAP